MGEITTMPQNGTERHQIATLPPQGIDVINNPTGRPKRKIPPGIGKHLTNKDIIDIVSDSARGTPTSQIAKIYGISRTRALKILNENRALVDKGKSDLKARAIEQIGNLVDEKRLDVVSAIGQKDYKKASLKSKTSALYDLTQVSRLEKGLSTVNQNIVVADLTSDQLKQFIRTGSVDNSSDVQGDVVDAQPSNGQVNGIDGIDDK